MNNIFLISEVVDKYRWISIAENRNDWGARLSLLREQPVPQDFGPVEVEWTPETFQRSAADFVNFRTDLKCINYESSVLFDDIFKESGQMIRLSGLNYIAYYCTYFSDCISSYHTENKLKHSIFSSLHSPKFCPVLERCKLPNVSIFHIPESNNKFFVDEVFKNIYDHNELTGLEFFPVDLV